MFETTNQKKVFQVHEALVSTNPFSKHHCPSEFIFLRFWSDKTTETFQGRDWRLFIPLACMGMVYLPILICHENQGFHLGKYTSLMDCMGMGKQNENHQNSFAPPRVSHHSSIVPHSVCHPTA